MQKDEVGEKEALFQTLVSLLLSFNGRILTKITVLKQSSWTETPLIVPLIDSQGMLELIKYIPYMQCKLLRIKASAKCIHLSYIV